MYRGSPVVCSRTPSSHTARRRLERASTHSSSSGRHSDSESARDVEGSRTRIVHLPAGGGRKKPSREEEKGAHSMEIIPPSFTGDPNSARCEESCFQTGFICMNAALAYDRLGFRNLLDFSPMNRCVRDPQPAAPLSLAPCFRWSSSPSLLRPRRPSDPSRCFPVRATAGGASDSTPLARRARAGVRTATRCCADADGASVRDPAFVASPRGKHFTGNLEAADHSPTVIPPLPSLRRRLPPIRRADYFLAVAEEVRARRVEAAGGEVKSRKDQIGEYRWKKWARWRKQRMVNKM